jgi:hypothetical protein
MTDFWTSPTLVTTPSESTVPRECDACLSANNRILLELPSEKVVNHYAFGANHYHSGRFVRIAVQLVISGTSSVSLLLYSLRYYQAISYICIMLAKKASTPETSGRADRKKVGLSVCPAFRSRHVDPGFGGLRSGQEN